MKFRTKRVPRRWYLAVALGVTILAFACIAVVTETEAHGRSTCEAEGGHVVEVVAVNPYTTNGVTPEKQTRCVR